MTPPRPRVAPARFVLLYGLLVLWQVWRLLLTPHGVASTWTRGDDVEVVSMGGAGVSQEILMGADGFDGLWVRTSSEHSERSPLGGHVVVTLALLQGDRPVPVQRTVVDAAAVGIGRTVHLPFQEIRASRGTRYQVTLAHTGSDDRGVLHVEARRSDAHPNARFFVDGAEQWGDLLFETSAGRATLPYWKHDVLGPWPAWMQSWWTVGGVLLLVNLLLASACFIAVTRTATEGEPARLLQAEHGPVARRAALFAVSVIVTVGIGALLWPVPPLRVIRLTDHLADARIETSMGSVHEGIDVRPVAIHGRVAMSVIALPTSRMTWTVEVPIGALLTGHAAMRPDVWHEEGDGVNLTVSVTAENGDAVTVAQYTLVPYVVGEHRALHPIRVSLDPWSGQTVTLTLETDPERWGNAVNDVPVWVDPRIEWPRGTAWGDARISRP